MSIVKRASLIAIAILLVFSTLSISAVASDETGSMNVVITASPAADLYPGETVTFTINITNDYMCTGMRWPIMFSTKVFELVTTVDEYGDENVGNVHVFGSLAALGSSLTSSDRTGDPAVHSSRYKEGNYGCLIIQWLGQTNNGQANYYQESLGLNCITFQLKVKESPNSTSGKVIIPTDAIYSDMFYLQGTSDPVNAVYYVMDKGNLTVTTVETNVTCFDTFAALTPKVNTDTIIDDEHGYIYGLTRVASDFVALATEDDFATFVTAAGGATYTLTPNASGMYSTGALVEVFDARGTKMTEYTVVVFGDINGDSVCDGTDTSMILDASMSEYEFTWTDSVWDNAQYLSCDVDATGVVDGSDYGVGIEAMQFNGYIGQSYDSASFYIPTVG